VVRAGPSFVPPPEIRQLRDLTRYRADLAAARTAEKQRVEKLLEDAQIKLGVVVSDIFGVSGRQMLDALISGQRDPKALARVDAIDADIAALDASIEQMAAPFTAEVRRLAEIPGISFTAACAILAEIGTSMDRFPTAGHLVSWAKFAPGVKESAGKKKGKSTTGHGNRYLARVLGNAAASIARTDTFLGERYRRIARRRGSQKAVVAIGRSLLVIIWHLLADPTARYTDLGSDFYDTRTDPERRKRTHIRQLQALGYKVTLEPAA
jgi:transposase